MTRTEEIRERYLGPDGPTYLSTDTAVADIAWLLDRVEAPEGREIVGYLKEYERDGEWHTKGVLVTEAGAEKSADADRALGYSIRITPLVRALTTEAL